ncbi:O-antigen ligase family protein [Anditalea andensis]|uniref:O-antigen ligase-related domain-containing protein n=1 Tax=Anditalea andensis TaxID=1048983 RepID=A0A074L3Z3_9BACT|nr:O-antigen ligase family protein [Anditalea andensis]KEO75150.1 hypothetical protein EL17_05635 [Anditalea andensis]
MRSSAFEPTYSFAKYSLPLIGLIILGLGWLTAQVGIIVPGVLIALPFIVAYVTIVFYKPKAGFVSYIILCFFVAGLSKHVPSVPFGLGLEGILLLTWLAVIFHRSEKYQRRFLKNDLFILSLVWFVITVLEILNPAGASFMGWVFEMRSTALYWILTVPLAFMLLREIRDIKLFIYAIIVLSCLGAIYGAKQLYFGVDSMEQLWLDAGSSKTHVLWGKLRVFSFYSDAGQFGASQAHVGLICLILSLGPYLWWKRLLVGAAGLLILYGMLISGTRGSMFVLIAGGFVYLVLSKQAKILILGSVMAISGLFILKYTTLGESNAQIARMRTSLDPKDPSLQERFKNQNILKDYLSSRPFGGGVGVIGTWGMEHNPDKFLANIPPDSYFVKVWAMYGIVGFILWFGIILYITGKCCGIVWNIRNEKLRQVLIALVAGISGIILSSYGNEVINTMPSAMIVYISWALVYLGPHFDQQLANSPSHA